MHFRGHRDPDRLLFRCPGAVQCCKVLFWIEVIAAAVALFSLSVFFHIEYAVFRLSFIILILRLGLIVCLAISVCDVDTVAVGKLPGPCSVGVVALLANRPGVPSERSTISRIAEAV